MGAPSYRPICDVWILGRSKVKYYGAYPAGFLRRARGLLGVGPEDPVLHVCGGKVRDYPYEGFGANDKTLDLDPTLEPDFCLDAREGLPFMDSLKLVSPYEIRIPLWPAVLIDRPYTEEDADQYLPGREYLPTANELLRNAVNVVRVGGRIGMLDYTWPQPPANAREYAVVAVGTGRNNRARWFVVMERTA